MKKFFILLSVLFLLNIVNFTVKADDRHDDDDDYEEYEYYKEDWRGEDDDEEYDDDEDDEYYYDNEQMNDIGSSGSHWYLWTRTVESVKGELPFSEPKNVAYQNSVSGEQLSIYSIPSKGEIFIPGKRVSEFLGAKAVFYPASRILEISKDDTELIFRADTNVSYEDKVKTPIPAAAMFFNGDVYLPISVVANGLGFSVEWDEQQQVFLFSKLIQ